MIGYTMAGGSKPKPITPTLVSVCVGCCAVMRGQNDGTFRLFTESDWHFFRKEEPRIYKMLQDALTALRRHGRQKLP